MYNRVNQRPVFVGGNSTGMTGRNAEHAALIGRNHLRALGRLVTPEATAAAEDTSDPRRYSFNPATAYRRPTA